MYKGIYQNLFLPRVLACPVRVLLKRVGVKHAPDITAASGVFVVVPCSADARALLYDDEVVALVAFHEINGHAHAF